jgi:hypothetical protein
MKPFKLAKTPDPFSVCYYRRRIRGVAGRTKDERLLETHPRTSFSCLVVEVGVPAGQDTVKPALELRRTVTPPY